MVEKIKNALETVSEKFKSRRYFSMWMLTIIIVALFLLPPAVSFIVEAVTSQSIAFVILDQITFAGLLGWIWAAYLTSDYKTKSLGQYMDDVSKFPTQSGQSNSKEQ